MRRLRWVSADEPCCDALHNDVAALANLVGRLAFLGSGSGHAIIERRADAIRDKLNAAADSCQQPEQKR